MTNATSLSQPLKIQYVSDEQGEIQSVIVPIELWRAIAPVPANTQQPGNPSAGSDVIQDTKQMHKRDSLFGAFPELAAIEFGEDFEEIKLLWRNSIDKQIAIIQGEME